MITQDYPLEARQPSNEQRDRIGVMSDDEYRVQEAERKKREGRAVVSAVLAFAGVDVDALVHTPVTDWEHSDERLQAAEEKRARKQAKRLREQR